MQATITSKGQVTLPKPIRDRLHLKPGDKIDFMLEDDGCLPRRARHCTGHATQGNAAETGRAGHP